MREKRGDEVIKMSEGKSRLDSATTKEVSETDCGSNRCEPHPGE